MSDRARNELIAIIEEGTQRLCSDIMRHKEVLECVFAYCLIDAQYHSIDKSRDVQYGVTSPHLNDQMIVIGIAIANLRRCKCFG